MTTEQKCAEILKHIVDQCNDHGYEWRKPRVAFYSDFGGCSLTVETKEGHTHVGNHWDDPTPESFPKLIDDLHALMVHGRGLSLA